MQRLKNKIALITGAAMGMGEAEARLFAENGASLVLTDINTKALDKVAEELLKQDTKIIALKLDVSSEQDWIQAAQ